MDADCDLDVVFLGAENVDVRLELARETSRLHGRVVVSKRRIHIAAHNGNSILNVGCRFAHSDALAVGGGGRMIEINNDVIGVVWRVSI